MLILSGISVRGHNQALIAAKREFWDTATRVCAREGLGHRGGTKRRPRQGEVQKARPRGIIEAGVLLLASLQRGSLILREDCYNVVTRAPTVGNDLVVPDSKREGRHARAMLFWVLAALAVVGALAIVWGLYLLVRRWL